MKIHLNFYLRNSKKYLINNKIIFYQNNIESKLFDVK
ncbi:hypothetical protein SPLC1_S131670 [Arthrospira platensis C1]|nr:hypothetical protein SPLC1_S131670 [Arthrospira platensis C1]